MNISVKDFQCVGFSGFYYGAFDTSEMVYDSVREIEDEYNIERGTLTEDVDYTVNYKGYEEDICLSWVDFYNSLIHNALELDFDLEFDYISRPKYYNFDTDKIYCNVKCKDFKKVMRKVLALMESNKEKLEEIIYKNHTSYDGFISFMENHYDEWYNYLSKSRNYNDSYFSLYFSYIIMYLCAVVVFPDYSSRKACEELLDDFTMCTYEGADSIDVYIDYTDEVVSEYNMWRYKD